MNSRTRRSFLKTAALAGGAAATPHFLISATSSAYPRPDRNAISLATWSIVRSFRAGVWKLTDVARICREDFGIDGIEYVTSFFEVPVETYLRRLNKAAADHGVQNVLIMVDGEGSMVAKEKDVRMQAAVNHRKWIEIAAFLGCHAIRCNAHGGERTAAEDPDSLSRAAESFHALIDYAREFSINVVIENHGGLSSDPHWLPKLIQKVGSSHFGILPDYGNYDLTGETDVYEAVRLAMPYAQGVSVKAAWNPDGSHPEYDLERLLAISLASGYSGFWGIESSMRRERSSRPGSPEEIQSDDWKAVLWTKEVIEKVVFAGSTSDGGS